MIQSQCQYLNISYCNSVGNVFSYCGVVSFVRIDWLQRGVHDRRFAEFGYTFTFLVAVPWNRVANHAVSVVLYVYIFQYSVSVLQSVLQLFLHWAFISN